MTNHRFVLALFFVLGSSALLAPSALANSHSVKKGSWKASVTYKHLRGHGKYVTYSRLRVTIKHHGKTVVKRRPVKAGDRYERQSIGRPRWLVANLDSDRDPEFVLRWSNGCAHSCLRANVFGAGAAKARPLKVSLVDGFRLMDLDRNGVKEIVGSDHRFAYQFASFASSPLPITVISVAGGSVADVTRQFQAAISEQSAQLLKAWNSGARTREGGGVAAAYAADLCLLGRQSEAFAFLEEAQESTTVWTDDGELGYNPDYAAEAQAFLVELGYC